MIRHDEEVCFEARRHGAVLAGPLTQAIVLALTGGILLAEPWPLPVPGAVLMVVAAGVVPRAGLGWGWTPTGVTTHKGRLLRRPLRRAPAAVRPGPGGDPGAGATGPRGP